MAQQYDLHEAEGLHGSDLLADPLKQLDLWLDDARAAKQIEPGAMTLATADAQGRPSARMVLYKGAMDGCLTFYTNHDSRKGTELAANQHVALAFWWDKLQRQVRVQGTATRMPQSQANTYYQSRSRGSRIGAWASRQSQPVQDRSELENRVARLTEQFDGQDVPIPDYWGGYLVRPTLIEFWQGRDSRLHDRLQYTLATDGWHIDRLEP